MKHIRHFSYQRQPKRRQKNFICAFIGGILLISFLNLAREIPLTRVAQKEYMLTGTTIQSIKEVVPYYDACNTIYDDNLYEDEVVVTQEGTAGQRETTTFVTYLNGYAVSEDIVDSRIVTPAIAREVHIGTKKRPDFIMPVDNYTITSYVGPRWGRSHNGIDLAVPVGTPVSSSGSGTIIQCGWNGGYGISVYVDHGNGIVTRYGHLSEAAVTVGQTVAQGDDLGLSGNTGNSTGPHLHFEMRVDDVVVNPLEYIQGEQ